MLRVVSLLLLFTLLLAGPVRAAPGVTAPASADLAPIIEEYRQQIPKIMQEQGIPGLAIAVVSREAVLWAEAFGCTDRDCGTPVTTATPFSIQSMSKSFTALAVMVAVQDGLVDLDEPITTYLPDFKITSIFEENPERKITLRHLLSHTAGLAHEAPIGNNTDLPTHTFEEHIASISETQLRFPVGARWEYSNLGIDLAGYILQVRSGMPFPQYLKEKVLDPLAMNHTTADFAVTRARADRALGHVGPAMRPPTTMLIVPSGGVYASLEDMTRYVRFYLNGGELDGVRLLSAEDVERMYTPQNAPAAAAGYGLGLATWPVQPRMIEHGGGGFGFLSEMAWYPEMELGVVLLTNYSGHNQQRDLPLGLMQRVLAADRETYGPRMRASQTQAAAVTASTPPLSNEELTRLIEAHALLADADAQHRWASLTGTYVKLAYGFPNEESELKGQFGRLYWDGRVLYEIAPALFMDSTGDVLDLRGPRLHKGNTPLLKKNTTLLVPTLALFGAGGLLALVLLLFWPVRAVIQRLRKAPVGVGTLLGWAWLPATLAGLAFVICLGILATMPLMLYPPWPAPFADMGFPWPLVFSMPYAALLLSLLSAGLLAPAWRASLGPRRVRILFSLAAGLLATASLVLIF